VAWEFETFGRIGVETWGRARRIVGRIGPPAPGDGGDGREDQGERSE
jgi:hypothetical protein